MPFASFLFLVNLPHMSESFDLSPIPFSGLRLGSSRQRNWRGLPIRNSLCFITFTSSFPNGILRRHCRNSSFISTFRGEWKTRDFSPVYTSQIYHECKVSKENNGRRKTGSRSRPCWRLGWSCWHRWGGSKDLDISRSSLNSGLILISIILGLLSTDSFCSILTMIFCETYSSLTPSN